MGRLRIVFLAWSVLTLAVAAGCAHDEPTPNLQPPATTPQHTERPDPGPQFKRAVGRWSSARQDQKTIQATGKLNSRGHSYVIAPLPDGLTLQPSSIEHITVESGGVYGLAMPGRDPQQFEVSSVMVRFVGDAPASFAVTVHQRTTDIYRTGDTKPGISIPLRVEAVDKAKNQPDLEQRFHLSAASWFQSNSHNSLFYSFAAGRAELLGRGSKRPTNPADLAAVGIVRPGDQSEMGALMDLYTGLTSVEEALQTRRALMLRDAPQKQTIPVSSLAGVPLASHPWEQMLGDLGRKPSSEPLAGFVPEDMLYLHFHDLRTFAKLLNDLDEVVTPLSLAMESRPGTSHFTERINRQLVVERTALSETFGNLAVHGVAVAASDPFWREGSDLSLLFHLKNEGLLTKSLDDFAENARRLRPDIKEATYDIDGIQVRSMTTADRVIHQHRAKIGDVLIISNSRAAMERFVAVHKGRARSLSNAGDFRYMRARYPFGADNEDGFLFISDAFVARVVSPRVKILQARRMVAAADLTSVDNAALLFGWYEGRPPKDARELVASGFLSDAELRHADGSPIDFSADQGASSARWGRPQAMAPLIEAEIDKVTEAERDAYAQFVTGYQQYWQRMIDPIGVRIHRDDTHLGVEALMLPLIEGTEYNDLSRQVGKRMMPMPTGFSGFGAMLAVGDDAELRRVLDGMAHDMTQSRDIGLGWLGDWVMVGVGDRSGLWDMALLEGAIPGSPPDLSNAEQVLGRFPLYIGAHIRNKLGLAATLTAIRGFMESSSPGIVAWAQGDPYRDIPVTMIREKDPAGREPIGIHYAIAGDVLLASFDRATLERQMDVVLDGQPAPEGALKVQSALLLAPERADGWLNKAILGMMEALVVDNTYDAARELMALARGRGLATLPGDPAELQRLALTWLGRAPASAHGGTFTRQPDGTIHHSLYGSATSPSLPEIPVKDAPLSRAMNQLLHLKLALSFDGEGQHAGLRVNADWKHR